MAKERGFSSDHRHCVVCGKSVATDKSVCSQKCEEEMGSRRKAQRRNTWVFLAIIGGMALVFFVLLPLLAPRPPAP